MYTCTDQGLPGEYVGIETEVALGDVHSSLCQNLPLEGTGVI